MSVKVERMKTNFFPKAICKPGKSKEQGTAIYVSDSKDVPLESFQPDVEQDVYFVHSPGCLVLWQGAETTQSEIISR